MPHLPPAHHETSKRDSPNETKIKEKQNKTVPDSNSNLTKSMTITIKPRNWPLSFSISSLMSLLTTKAQSLKFESKTAWCIARKPKKPRKAQEGHLEEGKPQKPTIGKKSGKTRQNGSEELERAQRSKKRSKSTQKLKKARKAQKLHKSSKSTPPWNQLPLTLSTQALPLR
jgi:hypothetical protein